MNDVLKAKSVLSTGYLERRIKAPADNNSGAYLWGAPFRPK